MPTTIQYATQLLCENPEIQHLPVESIEKMIGEKRGFSFLWTDTLLDADGKEIPAITEGYDPSILDKLVICEMGTLGVGVFAKERIPRGTIIGNYSGEITSLYQDNPPLIEQIYVIGLNEEQGINAAHRGNICGLFQHLEKCTFSKHCVSELATDNLLAFDKDGHTWFKTSRDILPNEQLGMSYGNVYWDELKVVPAKFDRLGRKLSFQSVFCVSDLYELLFCLARVLRDEERLMQLKKIYPEQYQALMERINPFRAAQLLLQKVLSSHQDLLRVMYPHDRKTLLDWFTTSTFFLKPTEHSLYPKQYIMKFVRFSAPHPQTPSLKKATLDIPEDYFKICNPLRYYTWQQPESMEQMQMQRDSLATEGDIAFRHEDYAYAAQKWEQTIMIARNLLAAETFLREKTLPIFYFEQSDGEKAPFLLNDDVIKRCWDLGLAYYMAAQSIDETPAHVTQYQIEAEYCMRVTIQFIEARPDSCLNAKLSTYKATFEKFFPTHKLKQEVAVHAEPIEPYGAAAGSADEEPAQWRPERIGM